MTPVLAAHIASGSLGILSGFVALYSTKGLPIHRRAGMLFVVVMLAMTTTGAIVAATLGAAPAINIAAAVLTTYLVVTGLTSVRPPSDRRAARALHVAMMIMAAALATYCLVLAANPSVLAAYRRGIPPFPYYLFGFVGTCAAIGDFVMLRAGVTVSGAPRIARHLWRMSFALWIAVMSFFIGQADEFPKEWRIMPLLAVPVVAVLVTMLYWLWRVRVRRSLRGLFERATAPEVTPRAAAGRARTVGPV
jgi:hypothetical protein